jgi:hypothetical protein
MDAVIDLGSEVLVDRSKVRTPQVRLLLKAIGQPLARGSAWVAVSKGLAEFYSLLKRASLSSNGMKERRLARCLAVGA